MSLAVIFLPGIIMPAADRYSALIKELGADVNAISKDLEVYRLPDPPPTHTRSRPRSREFPAPLVSTASTAPPLWAFSRGHPRRLRTRRVISESELRAFERPV
jgi:hypothetical protein